MQQFAPPAAAAVVSVVAAVTAAQLFWCPHAVVPVFSLLEAAIPILLPAKCTLITTIIRHVDFEGPFFQIP